MAKMYDDAIKTECITEGFKMDMIDIIHHRRDEAISIIEEWRGKKEQTDTGKRLISDFEGVVETCDRALNLFEDLPICGGV